MRMRNNLSDDSFRREALGIWDETVTAYAIDPDQWKAAAIDEVPEGGTVSFGLDMPPDRSVLTIGAASRYKDGSAVIQMANIKDARQAGTMWAVDWLAERWHKTASVVIDAQSPAMSLLPDLKAAHVKVTVTNMQEMGRACGRFLDMLKAGTLRHPPGRIPAAAGRSSHGRDHAPIGTVRRNRLEQARLGYRHNAARIHHTRPVRRVHHETAPRKTTGGDGLMVFYMADGTTISTAPKFTGSSYLDTASGNIGTIIGVDDEDMPIIHELLRVWREKYPRNLIRGAYYDCKERFKDFGISIPDQIKNKVEAMIGWPELAVRSLSDLSDLEGFSISGDDTMGINDLFEDNQLDVTASELIVSSYKHSCSFLTIAADPEDPERISMIPRSADWSAGMLDRRNHRLAAALTITEDDKDGRICSFNVWLPGKVYECSGRPLPWRAEKSKRTSTSRRSSRSPTTDRWTARSATAASAARS